MANRKKRRRSGKKKSETSLSHEGKLGTKLLGYWKKGLYGEFVTLFLRYPSRAQKTEAAGLWDPAVYNLLLYALFEAKEFSLLDGFFQNLQGQSGLSEATLAAMEVAKAARDLHLGQASLEQLRSLPDRVPSPYSELRDYLASIPDRAESSALSEYLDGRRIKARKGEKHLALAGRFAHQLRELSQVTAWNQTTTFFTQLRNKLKEMRDLTRERQGQESKVLKDATIVADLLRELMARPDNFREEIQVQAFLRRSGFGFSAHPFVCSCWKTVLWLGGWIHGSGWEQSIRLALGSLQEGMLPGLPEYITAQLRARNRLAQQKQSHSQGLFSDIFLTLQEGVWSRRERIVLLYAMLVRLKDVNQELFQPFTIPLDLHPDELKKLSRQAAHMGCQTMLELMPLLGQMRPNQFDTLAKALNTWCCASSHLPMDGVEDQLSAIAREISGLDLPPHIWLFLLLKGGEIYSRLDKDPLLEIIEGNNSHITLDEITLDQAVYLLRYTTCPARVLERWSVCLESSAQQALARKFLLDYFHGSAEPEDELFCMGLDSWLDIPRELMEELVHMAGEDFELRGLCELTLRKEHSRSPLPANQEEADFFLNRPPPPPETLYRVLLWMLRFEPTRASDLFLQELVGHVVEYALQQEAWRPLAEAIKHHGSEDLAFLVWQMWQRRGLLDAAPTSKDFELAKQCLKSMAFQGKSVNMGAKRGKHAVKKTLLDEVLEERRRERGDD